MRTALRNPSARLAASLALVAVTTNTAAAPPQNDEQQAPHTRPGEHGPMPEENPAPAEPVTIPVDPADTTTALALQADDAENSARSTLRRIELDRAAQRASREAHDQREEREEAARKAAEKAAAQAAREAERAAQAAYPNNLDGWIQEALAVMDKHNIPGSYNGIYRNIMRESGGNPNAINDWDINAQNGTPSIGLLQVIKPTFDAYHVPGTAWSQYDPVANIAAACNYAADRYGSIDNVNSAY